MGFFGKGQDGTATTTREQVSKSEKGHDEPATLGIELGQDDQSNEVKDKGKKEPEKAVPYLELFRYSTAFEKFMIIVGCVGSLGHGVLVPCFTILFGDIINAFTPDTPPDLIFGLVADKAKLFIMLGCIAFVCSYFQVFCLMWSAQRQGRRMRELYFRSLLKQEMDWYDGINSAELTSRVSGDVIKVEDGIGDKVGNCLQYMAMFIAGFSIGFSYGWKLTLVILAAVPLLAICGAFLAKLTSEMTSRGQTAYARAGGVAEEALSLIRTVVAFGGEDREKERYRKELMGAYSTGIRQGHVTGLGMGLTMGIMFCLYALGFWYGNKLVQADEMQPGSVLTVFFSIVMGGMAIGQAAPSFTAFAVAKGAAYHLFEVIARKPAIDSLATEGKILDHVEGDISFEHVDFTYSSRKEGLILRDLNITVKRGQTLALVGHSGNGKSTTIQLIERYYDPLAGAVKLDGVDIKDLNVQWYRSQIGLVSQMPTLFAMTIAENIALGAGLTLNKDFNPSHPESASNRRFVLAKASQAQIEEAAKMANAHNFIMKLPEGYATLIGERGAQLSGGQKQRIAIARALVKNPRILLLDEATSALDSHSERVVQDALEKASQGRTTVVIAHRLSTIKNADVIAVVEGGHIVEAGTNAELMAIPDGLYRKFVELQQMAPVDEKTVENEESDVDDVSHTIDRPKSTHARPSSSTTRPISSARQPSQAGTNPATANQEEESDSDSDSEDESEKAKNDKDVDPGMFQKVLMLNRSEWGWLALGIIGAAISGAMWPVFSLIFAEIIGVMVSDDNDKVLFWVYMFLVAAAVVFTSNYVNAVGIAVAGERLTLRVRTACFEAMIHQSIGWFDHHENGVGTLTTRLSTEAADVKLVSGSALSVLVTQVTTIVVGLVIAFTATWKLALVVLVCVPTIAIGAGLQMRQMAGFAADGSKIYRHAGKIAGEAVDNVRTVTSLSAAIHFLDRYDLELAKPAKKGFKTALIAGLGFGFTEFMMFAIWAISFWYGAKLAQDGEVDFTAIMKAISAIVFGAMTAGQVAAIAPDGAKAKVAATKVFRLLALVPEIDSRNPNGRVPESLKGDVAFKDIEFVYPTRPEVTVLKALSVDVANGQTLALVGESGCGKSTTIALSERFYNPKSGQVLVDGVPIHEYNLRWLRSQIGIVSQEPDLFNTTVRENILYGLPKDQLCVVTQDMIETAAKLANAHEFIMGLPQGYDSPVGERGSHLSGGQRQRVAIARALIRNPKILLLDEATSALDSESEKVVQVALDQAQKGRTTIVIAHRLSTIQDADKIAVVKEGVVAELGSHSQLIGKGGLYAQLVENQRHTV
eukprot:comp21970_c0_seq1/m.31708 comp21970_c0_seq1/g.31708  ORF comp21970_c0_seq1/g.31708 comp21970_c0_seq1/m.31708 type:complete len:1325 (-) comp21970_c0_seq1:487-4461(-)